VILRDLQAERARNHDSDVISYLRDDIFRNALDLWHIDHSDSRYELYVCRVTDDVKAHLGLYRTPEAIYLSLGGEANAAKQLISLVPDKAVIITTSELLDMVRNEIKYDAIYKNDLMLVRRGEERVRNLDLATKLSPNNALEYSTFGSSFNVPQVPMDWIHECLERDIIFGAFDQEKLASVASLVAWLPQVAVIMGVETKPEFRRKGLGTAVVSAAVKEGLTRSEACSLFVRSDNKKAVPLYESLGFKKMAEEIWVDIGTGLIP
jgi:ribosomal protein S18 acetylase RimI-like enzyme